MAASERSLEPVRANEATTTVTEPRTYYDRGDRVLWNGHFDRYPAGSLPQGMKLESGDLEIVTISGRNFLRSVNGAMAIVSLSENLPTRFSIELEYDAPFAQDPFTIEFPAEGQTPPCILGSLGHQSFLECADGRHPVLADLPPGGMIHPRFTVDGDHVTAYINEQLLPVLPNTTIARVSWVRLRIPAGTSTSPTLLSVINIAEGGMTYPQ